MNIAFIGAGNMGASMARNLLRAGHAVAVHNRTRSRAEPLAADGATVADSPAGAARGAEVVITMLADDAAVDQAVHSFVDSLQTDAIHLCTSTISVACAKRLAALHTERGQTYVAAPVFGRPEAAAAAKLWIVAAGAQESIARCQPVFDAIGRGASVVGAEPWLANAVKIAGNFLIAAAIESLGESFALVRKCGVDASQFLEIVNTALFNSPLYAGYGGAIAKEKYEPAGFKLTLGFKDLRLAQEAAEGVAVPMPLAGILRDRYLAAIARGDSDLDWAAIARIAAIQAGL